MLNKKGQDTGSVIKWAMMLIIVVLVLIFGYLGIGKIMEKSCQGDVTIFMAQLEESLVTMSSDFGSVEEKSYNVPCNADKIIFASRRNVFDLSVLDSYPVVQDSLNSEVQDNVFLMKKGELISTGAIIELDVERPFVICLNSIASRFRFFLEGKNPYSIIRLVNKADSCEGIEAVVVDDPVIEDDRPLKDILSDVLGEDLNLITKLNINEQSRESNTINLKILNTRGNPITLALKLKKLCKETIRESEISPTPDFIIEDPVIMWHFETTESPHTNFPVTINDDDNDGNNLDLKSQICSEYEAIAIKGDFDSSSQSPP